MIFKASKYTTASITCVDYSTTKNQLIYTNMEFICFEMQGYLRTIVKYSLHSFTEVPHTDASDIFDSFSVQ